MVLKKIDAAEAYSFRMQTTNECRRVSILAAVYENRSDVELYQVLQQ